MSYQVIRHAGAIMVINRQEVESKWLDIPNQIHSEHATGGEAINHAVELHQALVHGRIDYSQCSQEVRQLLHDAVMATV